MQETCFSGTSLTLPKSPAKNSGSSQRSSRDLDEPLTENDHDRCSLASFGSGNTTDSDNKVSARSMLLVNMLLVYSAAGGAMAAITKQKQTQYKECKYASSGIL